MHKKKIIAGIFAVLLIISAVVVIAVVKHHKEKEKKKKAKEAVVAVGTYDYYGRLVYYPGKEKVACPKQDEKTAVFLVIGQSNAANHAEMRYSPAYKSNVINYFNGECFAASSPLLGATGEEGEFITMIADKLLSARTYENIVIISAGVGGSPISRWEEFGDLNESLTDILKQAVELYSVTHIIWHQGERNFGDFTTQRQYTASFRSMMKTIKPYADAPYFIAVATKCGKKVPWYPDSPVALAQRALVDNRRVFLGADTDSFALDDRRGDHCHLVESGQEKAANAYFRAIKAQADAARATH